MSLSQLFLTIALVLLIDAVARNTVLSPVRLYRMYRLSCKIKHIERDIALWGLLVSTHPDKVPRNVDENTRQRLNQKVDELLEENKRINRGRNWLGR